MTDIPQYDPEVVDAPRQQVDRRRRFRFVATVVGFCLVASVGLTVFGITGSALMILVEGLISLATILSLWYVSGSVVDYNGGFGGMVRRPVARSSSTSTQTRSSATPAGTGLPPRR